ncbi:hypothetical protein ACFVUH_37125, partial [Kitasatospora sp. NPDC058032]|uniref:hypothetical protein n=1 Tax=Kitasatospora sp. NPDC058032 TaxID=3346307 RepID=UPI0036DCE1D4
MTPTRPEAPSHARVLDFATRTADLLERAARAAAAETPDDDRSAGTGISTGTGTATATTADAAGSGELQDAEELLEESGFEALDALLRRR